MGVFIDLWFNTVQHTWEWDGFTDMLGPCHKGYHTLDTDTEATMWNCSILTKIKVEFIFCRIHTKVIHFSNKSIVVFLTHRTTDDFAIAFWCKQVCTEDTVWISRNWLHVEGFDSCWVVHDKGWYTKVV